MEKNEFLTLVVEKLLQVYSSIYLVNLDTNEYEWASNNDGYLSLHIERNGQNFFEDLIKDINDTVYVDDIPLVKESLSKENIFKCLNAGVFPEVRYRLLISGKPIWHMMKILSDTKTNHKYIIFGILNIQKEMEMVEEKKKMELENEIYRQMAEITVKYYDVLYYIDIETNEYLVFWSANDYVVKTGEYYTSNFFDMQNEATMKYTAEKDRNLVLKRSSKEEVLKELETRPMYSFVFQMKYLDMEYYCRQSYFMMQDKKHIVMGLENINREKLLELNYIEEKKQNAVYSEIVDGLASHYDVIYYVDVETDDYSSFSNSGLFARIANEKEKVRHHFFDVAKALVPDHIHPDDIPTTLNFFDKEYTINTLNTLNKVQLTCRLIFNGKSTYIRTLSFFTRNKKHILYCIENADNEVRTMNKMKDMATKDALTGVRNKNAYQEFETQISEEIKTNPNIKFGIVMFDINNLKSINDNLGHQEGDEYIKVASKIICEHFKHSPVYRIGGDEFLVVLRDYDYEQRFEIVKKLKEEVKNNDDNVVAPKLALGMCEYNREKYNTIQDIFERADYLMYKNKKEMKETE